jgi:hypothetical protein
MKIGRRKRIEVIDFVIGAGEGIRTLDPNLGKVVLSLPVRLRRCSKASHIASRRAPQNSQA